jgi:ATP-dependent Lon protease
MAKIEEPRPRAKRTGKESNAALADTPQVGVSAEAMQGDAVVTEPEAGEPDGNEVLELPVLPLRGTVVFPLTVVPLAAAQPRSLRLIDEVMSGDRTVALVMQKDAELEGAGPDDIYDVGTISTIHQMMRVPDGTVRLAVQGNERMRVLEFLSEEPYLVARVQRVPEVIEESVEVDALTRNTLELFQRLVSLECRRTASPGLPRRDQPPHGPRGTAAFARA